MQNQLETPVLLIFFDRLDTTERVFKEIKKAKPQKLFIACDGPKNKRQKEDTDKVKNYILENIDWNCEVKKNFPSSNSGPGKFVSGSVSWLFEHEEQGIVLEHDCLPNQDFFRYCQELLNKYKDEERIMGVCGVNFLGKTNIKDSYWFSKTFAGWGWATWKRVWDKYDYNIFRKKRITFSYLLRKTKSLLTAIKLSRHIGEMKRGNIDTWDIQLFLLQAIEGYLTTIPRKNLVENIGFDEKALITRPNKADIRFYRNKRSKLNFPLRHPKESKQNKKLDRKLNRRIVKKLFSKYILK